MGATCCTRRDWKNGKDIESLPFLALSVFCSGAVPTYSTHSQNTKFISLSRSLKKKHRTDLIILYGALLYSYISFRPEQLGTLSLL